MDNNKYPDPINSLALDLLDYFGNDLPTQQQINFMELLLSNSLNVRLSENHLNHYGDLKQMLKHVHGYAMCVES